MGGHAKGPWKLEIRGGYLSITDANGSDVIVDWDITEDREVGIFCDVEMEVANFTLMTAAPVLLEAAKDFVRKVDEGRARSVDSYTKFKDAIAQAERDQP